MLLEGKKGIVLGVANKNSIAWGISQAIAKQGGKIAFNYAFDKLESRVRDLADTLDGSLVFECDVTNDEHIESFLKSCAENGFDKIDFIVHSVAFAKKEDLMTSFVETSRDGFMLAHDTSTYSLVTFVNKAKDMINDGSSIVTLSYLGAERGIPNYNVMGVAKAGLEASVRYMALDLGERQIRVNAVSAGPVRTLAASGIAGFKEMLNNNAEKAPLRRNVEVEEVGNAAMFLVSPLSSGITGEILHVDCGFSTIGY